MDFRRTGVLNLHEQVQNNLDYLWSLEIEGVEPEEEEVEVEEEILEEETEILDVELDLPDDEVSD